MKKIIPSLGLVLGLLVAGVSFAHHGKGVQYEEKQITLSGTVTKIVWTNPHVFVYFDVKNDDGTVVNWGLENTNPRSLTRLGLAAEMFKPGNVMKFEFEAARAGLPRGDVSGGRIWDPDGKLIWDGTTGYRGVKSLYNTDQKSDKK